MVLETSWVTHYMPMTNGHSLRRLITWWNQACFARLPLLMPRANIHHHKLVLKCRLHAWLLIPPKRLPVLQWSSSISQDAVTYRLTLIWNLCVVVASPWWSFQVGYSCAIPVCTASCFRPQDYGPWNQVMFGFLDHLVWKWCIFIMKALE